MSHEVMTKVDLMLIPLMCHVYVPFIPIVMEIQYQYGYVALFHTMSMITSISFPYGKEASITITYYRESDMEQSITKNYHVILHEARTS